MKRTFAVMFGVLGLALLAPLTIHNAAAADTGNAGAAMDQSLNNDQSAGDTTKKAKHHKKHHRTHKPAHSSAATSETAKTNGMAHRHHHKKKEADTGATSAAPAAPADSGEKK